VGLTDSQEAKSGKVVLKEDDPHVVAAMLHYLYHLDYVDEGYGDWAPMILDYKLYVMADKYQIEALQALAKDKFLKRVASQWRPPSPR